MTTRVKKKEGNNVEMEIPVLGFVTSGKWGKNDNDNGKSKKKTRIWRKTNSWG